jgi:hypothetical protein
VHEYGADVESLAVLSRFRLDFHGCLTARADELSELADAVLCADGPVRSLLSPPPRTVTEHPVFCAIFMIDDTSAAEAGCTTQAGRRRAASGKNTRSSAPAYAAPPGRAALSPSSSCSSRTLSDAESVMRCPPAPDKE